MKKITRRELLKLGGAAVAGNALIGCGKSVRKPSANSKLNQSNVPIVTTQGRILSPDAAPLEKQILYESVNEPRHLDIARDIYNAGVAINWGGEPLLRRDENQNLVPAMAESWQAGKNLEYWDFVIRENARWSDGVPITADDWVFTFRHLASPASITPGRGFITTSREFKIIRKEAGKPKTSVWKRLTNEPSEFTAKTARFRIFRR